MFTNILLKENMKIRLTLLWLLIMVATQFATAQTLDVNGTVRDSRGNPVIGATVAVKGGKTVAITDSSGKFKVTGMKASDKLVVSYLGLEDQEVKVRPNLVVTLEDDNTQLDEVMVVAFGKQKRSSFTGSASVVDSKNLEKKQMTNALSGLTGEVAGVQIVSDSGDPAAEPTIRIRGISSINAGNDPLIILDGAPYDGGINNINPSDIASLTVLKDAASNALYGARGANGVIMITTKSANMGEGKTTITFDGKVGANTNAAVDYDLIDNPGEYYEMYYKAMKNYFLDNGSSAMEAHQKANQYISKPASEGGLGYVVYTVPNGEYLIGENGKLNPSATLGNRIYNNGQYYTLVPDDWADEAYRTAIRQEYNINISSSLKNAQVYASLGYLNNEGVVENSDYERYTARIKANWQAKKWLNVGANASFAHSMQNSVDADATGIFWTLRNMAPIYPAYIRDADGNIMTDSNGKMYDYGDGAVIGIIRPVLSQTNMLQDNVLNTQETAYNNFSLNGFVDISPLEGLKITLNGTVTNTDMRYKFTYNPYYGYSAAVYPSGYIMKSQSQKFTMNFQQLINYSKTFGKHTISLLLGHENYKLRYDYLYGEKKDMASYFGNQNLNGAITVVGTGDYNSDNPTTDYSNEGWFFRGQYDYAEKYFASFSYRRDASSRFHPDHRWGNFFSFGAAWIVNKEKWFTASWVDQLKLKASIGQQGNDNIGEYCYTDLYSITNNNGSIGLTWHSKGNEEISWETNTNFNIGADFSLFKGRLTGSVEYFLRHTSDMLFFISAPVSAGYAGQYSNVGNMDNKGFEIDLHGTIIKNKYFTWRINLNATHYKNEITSLTDEVKTNVQEGHGGYISGSQFYGEGLPMYTWYMKKYAGVNEEGKSTWYMEDGTTTTDYSSANYFLCGDALPDLYGGFGTQIEVCGIDLSVNFNYSIGGKANDYIYRMSMYPPYSSMTGFSFHRDLYNSWTESNTDTDVPRFVYNDIYSAASSDRFLIDASYLTLQNISLGYTLPKKWIAPLKLSNVRIYCSADNICYWSKRKGFDPRRNFDGINDMNYYTPVRSISGGVNIQF